MKKLFIIIIFLFIATFTLRYCAYLYVPKHLGFNPKSIERISTNIDVIFVGPSTTHTAISPLNIWHKYGVTSYNLSASAQDYMISYYLSKAFKTNSTKIIFFDITNFVYGTNSGDQLNMLYSWYLNPKDRVNYYNLFNKKYYIYQYDLLYSLNGFHDRWKGLSRIDFTNNNLYGVRNLDQGLVKYNPQEPIHIKDNLSNNMLEENIIKFITELENFAKKNNIIVVYWIRPFTKNYMNQYKFIISFEQYIKKYRLNFINFNDSNLINKFDYKHDLIDRVHLNI